MPNFGISKLYKYVAMILGIVFKHNKWLNNLYKNFKLKNIASFMETGAS